MSENTLPQADYTFSDSCRLKKRHRASKVADQTTNRCGFWPKNWTGLIFFVGRLEAYLVVQTNRSGRPNMSLSIGLSVNGRWTQYNGQTKDIWLPTNQIFHTDQIFFQSTTSRPFCASRRRDWSVRGIPPSDTCTIYHIIISNNEFQ